MTVTDYTYIGAELAIFEKAANWKSYFRSQMASYIRGSVLEAGAGIGATTSVFRDLPVDRWVCLEPDAELARQIPSDREVIVGTTSDLPLRPTFDAVLYIDVIEHIEGDRAELARAASLLRPCGALIVLSPAHQSLYTPFDRAIGHYRRYSKSSLREVGPEGLRLEKLAYLDCAGLLASLANKVLLRQSMPTERQILTWDRLLVPVSRRLDPLFGHSLGKSVLGIWTRS